MPSTDAAPLPIAPLRQRVHEPEWMDEPDLDPQLHRQALGGLARLNTVGRSADILWRALRDLPRTNIRLLDVACGGGDVLLALARRARRHGYAWQFTGVDKSETALGLAAENAARQQVPLQFEARDVLANGLPTGHDVVVCSLFLHHLSSDDAVSFLSNAAEVAGSRLLVSDLRRTRTNYWLTQLGCQLLTRSPVVHKDGPLSIRAAFTIEEARQLATQAGLANARIEPRFPARWLLQWSPR